MMTRPLPHPIQLHKDYIKLEGNRKDRNEAPVQASANLSPEKMDLVKHRFLMLYGRGDLLAGHLHYVRYWDRVDDEARAITQTLGAAKKKAAFARHIGIDPTILSQYSKKQKVHKKFWNRLITMRKIVKGFKTFKKEMGE